jgi:hypothetical protein
MGNQTFPMTVRDRLGGGRNATKKAAQCAAFFVLQQLS